MKLTAEQIKQALEFCANCECNSEKTEKECALINMSFCKNYLRKQSLDYINRLEAENNVLHRDNDRLLKEIQDEKIYSRKIIEKYKSKLINAYKKLKRARTEAVKDFAERLKEDLDVFYHTGEDALLDTTDAIDNLVKKGRWGE